MENLDLKTILIITLSLVFGPFVVYGTLALIVIVIAIIVNILTTALTKLVNLIRGKNSNLDKEKSTSNPAIDAGLESSLKLIPILIAVQMMDNTITYISNTIKKSLIKVLK